MDSIAQSARADAGPESSVDLLIEKGFLLLGSIEFQIDEHLMANGTRIDPETRYFMAQVRDAAGDAAARLLDEARSRIDAAPVEQAPGSGDERQAIAAPTEATDPAQLPACPARGGTRRGRRVSVRRAAVQSAMGTACATLALMILLDGQASRTSPPAKGAEWAAAEGASTHASLVAVTDPAEPALAKASSPATAVTKAVRAKADASGVAAASDEAIPAIASAERGAEPASAPWTVTAMVAHDGAFPPYPNPLAGIEALASGPVDADAAAASEASLVLSRSDRREVQRRLALAAYDPELFDGILGPATRDALRAWQKAAGLPATGYLDEMTLTRLRDETDGAFREWKVAERARARRSESRTAVLTSPVPPASPARPEDRCQRRPSGKIVYGRGMRCDFRGLRENLAKLFG